MRLVDGCTAQAALALQSSFNVITADHPKSTVFSGVCFVVDIAAVPALAAVWREGYAKFLRRDRPPGGRRC